MSLVWYCHDCGADYPTDEDMQDHHRVCGVAWRNERDVLREKLAAAEKDRAAVREQYNELSAKLAVAERKRDRLKQALAVFRLGVFKANGHYWEKAEELLKKAKVDADEVLEGDDDLAVVNDEIAKRARELAERLVSAERERDEAQVRLRLLAHVEDNAVELVELRAEKARHADELLRASATLRDAERDAAFAREEAKRLAELEAAVVGFADSLDGQRIAAEKPHACETDESAPCTACDEMVRLHTAELVAEAQLLALGREIKRQSQAGANHGN